MKKNINIVLSVLLLFGMGCSVLNTGEQAYTPPSQKNHPRLLYPKIAQENAYTGDSKVLILISKTGTVDKINVLESSGFDLLDNAAIEYCKNLIFYPAKRNGETVYSRMEMDIKFDISTPVWSAKDYVDEVKDLYIKLERSSERNIILKEILDKHDEFVQNMSDALNFNAYVEQVISPELSAEWKTDWNAWPLSFLLYQDFIQRFKDYNNLADVKTQIRNSVIADIHYIENTHTNDISSRKEKENILSKIKKFISEQYPDIILKDVQLNG
jgi:protein TonB